MDRQLTFDHVYTKVFHSAAPPSQNDSRNAQIIIGVMTIRQQIVKGNRKIGKFKTHSILSRDILTKKDVP